MFPVYWPFPPFLITPPLPSTRCTYEYVQLPEFWLDGPEIGFAEAKAIVQRVGITVFTAKYD
jgi:hypothetical protein